jgi:molybdopterin molybdotransferase
MRAHVPDRLPTPDDAWSRVAERWCPPDLPIESVPLLSALGRVTAVAICSALDSPPFDRAAMDGYAVRAADVQRCERLRIAGAVPIGSLAETTLAEGHAISVATGSMIPRGADAVINLERTERTDAEIEISGAVDPGDNIVRRGEDVRCGAVALSAGRRLRPQDIGLLASLGHLHVSVRRRPAVAVLTTGDELRAPGDQLGPGQIYDCNAYSLAAQVQDAGGEVRIFRRLPDDADAIAAAVREHLGEAEITLLSGGSSVGTKDLTIDVLRTIPGTDIVVDGVAAKPGRPSIVAIVSERLVIGIPGNPVAAMVAFEMFGYRAVSRLLQIHPQETAVPRSCVRLEAFLETDIPSRLGREDYARVTVRAAARGGWLATLVQGTSSHLSSMVRADGFVVAPVGADGLRAGDLVEVTMF